jgi:hypothetical protein
LTLPFTNVLKGDGDFFLKLLIILPAGKTSSSPSGEELFLWIPRFWIKRSMNSSQAL